MDKIISNNYDNNDNVIIVHSDAFWSALSATTAA